MRDTGEVFIVVVAFGVVVVVVVDLSTLFVAVFDDLGDAAGVEFGVDRFSTVQSDVNEDTCGRGDAAHCTDRCCCC